ncbi:hypothetical protein CDAR_33411 [Caerostris darwini]|uniref:Uncharacterized protein n=1 Tax=Caerostris darwini TaxID=1538125 RepID=A0AAV4VE20_9ARAC|nr:hypothetical protein CDAR_33411 [Caerostris darwini]
MAEERGEAPPAFALHWPINPLTPKLLTWHSVLEPTRTRFLQSTVHHPAQQSLDTVQSGGGRDGREAPGLPLREGGRPPLRPGPLLRRGEAGASLLLHDRGHPDPQVEARGALPSRGVSPVEGRSPGSLPLLPAVRTRTLVPLPAAAAALPGEAPGRQPLAALCRSVALPFIAM